MLKQYVESLRRFFATEEGRDEIINDIEGRIAELFGETLKKGSICITDEDVKTIINSMGRPEDFEAEEGNVKSQLGAESNSYNQQKTYSSSFAEAHRRLYRDESHKLFGGVCSGIANYFSIDPIIVRILFVLFVGITFIPYFILWIAVPGTSSAVIGSQRKRLFRDPDTKLIGGVCSGLAQYFNVAIWIPRILFLIPFFSFVFRWGHWGWWDFPHFLSFTFSPGAVFVYIILWLVLPEAKSAADKLEMKGEKVDLNNIRSTIQGDMTGFKDRAQQFGSELKEKAQQFGDNFNNQFGGAAAASTPGATTSTTARGGVYGQDFTSDATMTAARKGGSRVGEVITVIAKIFAYFILGSILLGIVGGLFSIGVVLTGLLPAYSYVLDDGKEQLLAWGALILFIWVPVIAIVTWIIRRIARKKGSSNLIRSTFASLWLIGLVCFISLIVSIRNDFRYRNTPVEQNVPLTNPGIDKLEIKAVPFGKYYSNNWLRLEPFASFDEDTVYVRNIRLRVVKSTTDSFQVLMVKMANGRTKAAAENMVANMNFNIAQKDSVLMLDKGLAVTQQDKFRNQQVIVTVAVPVGKRIYINENIGWGENVRVDFGRNDDYWDWENNMETISLKWRHNVEYVMTEKGLERVKKPFDDNTGPDNGENEDNNDDIDAIEEFRKSREQIEQERQNKLRELEEIDRELQRTTDSTRYRYQPAVPKKDTARPARLRAQTKTTDDFSAGINDVLMIKFL
ncbi:MAG: PspC protein [Segetibacter sp.]|nr:PspC protein [Segetibacter sp.]